MGVTDAWGIDDTYRDAHEQVQRVPVETIAALRAAIGSPTPLTRGPLIVRSGESPVVGIAEVELEDGSRIEVTDRLPADLALGYHRLDDSEGERRLIVSPGACHLPEDFRAWGWAVQLYATRSAGSWGMGDFADLRHLVQWSERTGAEVLLVNPLVAVSPSPPRQPSPYYPASRRFLDPIYLRVEEVAGAERLGERLAAAARAGHLLCKSPFIDRDEVWRLKLAVLEDLWEPSDHHRDFTVWADSQGAALDTFAAWNVLAEDHGGDWRRWPSRYRDPSGPGTQRAMADRADRLAFHRWLQWLCRKQLDRAATGVALLQDLPIGIDPGGADAWAWQDLCASGIDVGAPPDEFNTRGQNWGLPPFVPQRLRDVDYGPFVETIRANLTSGGGLRIDHVMGLFRLFWIPDGSPPSRGGYVRYPNQDLLDIIALESHRAGAVVVGEDLGTVEPGVRQELARRRMLSYRLLWFEKEEPRRWPELSMASVTTHDLSTITGLWSGADLVEQRRFDLEPNVVSTNRIRSRIMSLPDVDEQRSSPADVVETVHRSLAEAPSRILCATLEDATLSDHRPNIPGTDPKRPNWSLALPKPIEGIVDDALVLDIVRIFNEAVAPDRVESEEHDDVT
ncbi:4-alpha-glucanotransferase [soil metagenome]